MVKSKREQLIRNFYENGMKLMMETPRNVAELLAVSGSSLIDLIDFDQMRLVKRTFIKRDYRRVESDVELTAPLRREKGRSVRRIMVYILIEHQSAPDRLMPLRVLDYVVQIFNFQVREWTKTHNSLSGIRLQPVLPVVFYTGTRRWDSLGTLSDVVERHELFGPVLPKIEPLYLSLRDIPPLKLEKEGGAFGWVLRLVQERKARSGEFRRLLQTVLKQLEAMPAQERMRWLELLSYIHALIYHERNADEIPILQETIESSVATDEYRQEVFAMGKSYAQVLIDRGREEGLEEGLEKGLEKGLEQGREEAAITTRKQTLLRLLSKRFGELPRAVSQSINATDDVAQLDAWLENFAMAKTLDDVGVSATDSPSTL